jgi:hypothetical protein
MMPATTSPAKTEQAEAVLKLIDALEELDDVQNVYSNGDFPDSAACVERRVLGIDPGSRVTGYGVVSE